MTGYKSLSAIALAALFFIVGLLTKAGIAHNMSTIIVFGIFDLLMLAFIKKKLEQSYGKSRAINMAVYGFGACAILVFTLIAVGI